MRSGLLESPSFGRAHPVCVGESASTPRHSATRTRRFRGRSSVPMSSDPASAQAPRGQPDQASAELAVPHRFPSRGKRTDPAGGHPNAQVIGPSAPPTASPRPVPRPCGPASPRSSDARRGSIRSFPSASPNRTTFRPTRSSSSSASASTGSTRNLSSSTRSARGPRTTACRVATGWPSTSSGDRTAHESEWLRALIEEIRDGSLVWQSVDAADRRLPDPPRDLGRDWGAALTDETLAELRRSSAESSGPGRS